MPITEDQKAELRLAEARMNDACGAMISYVESGEIDSEKQRILSAAVRSAIAEFSELFDRMLHSI